MSAKLLNQAWKRKHKAIVGALSDGDACLFKAHLFVARTERFLDLVHQAMIVGK